ncbi:MAG: polysaccharide deacetylase family protein [Prevotella sp.]
MGRLCVIILFLATVLMSGAQDIAVCKYRGDRAAAVSLTYDDGLLEHKTLVAPELEKRGLKGTFWIIGNMVGKKDARLGDRLTWDELREMEAHGHEIASHTWSHPNCRKVGYEAFMYDVWRNDSAFQSNLGRKPLTLAYPYNAKTDSVVAAVESGRIGSRTFQKGHGQQNNKTTLPMMTTWMHDLIERGEWGVTMTHGITEGYDKWYKPQELWQFYDTLAAYGDKVWTGTFAQVMSYVKERDALSLNIETSGAGTDEWRMTVTPTCPLDPQIFTQPLTMKLTGAEQNVKAVQDGKPLVCYGDREGRLIDFNPFGGPVTLTYTKVLNVIGDSYVQNHRRPVEETWHCKMARQAGFIYNNYGRNGGCVAFDRTHDGKYNFGPAMYTKTGMMDAAADYVIIIGGHNDAVKIKNNKDSLKMFRDSLELLITNIKTRCPHAKIGYVTPWYCDHPGFKQVCRTIVKVCRKYDIPVLDNYSKSSVIDVRNADFRKKYFQSPNDTAHLNDKGHNLFLPVGMEWFVKNIQ